MMRTLLLFFMSMILLPQSFSQDARRVDQVHGLPAGVKAPDFNAIDADSSTFKLSAALQDGPVVLIFYRGFWCPVCNNHLAQIQDSLTLITGKDATVVAISPEKPEYLVKMADKSGASFRLLYDEGYTISDAYDVTFTPKKSELVIYNTALKANMKESHSDDSQRLPIPATYIIDKKGTIVWRQFDPDYKNRSTVKSILENLPE